MNLPGDKYCVVDQGEVEAEGTSNITSQEPPQEDPVLSTFQQFLQKAGINVCHTTWNYPPEPLMYILSEMIVHMADWYQIMLQILGP